jgi:hypothetical protein
MCDNKGNRNAGFIEELLESEVFYNEDMEPPSKPPRIFAYEENYFNQFRPPAKPPRNKRSTSNVLTDSVNNLFFLLNCL